MGNLTVKNPPEFTSEVHKTEKEEFITAELENEIKSALLNNDVFLKALAEAIKKKSDEHIEDSDIHVTSQDKQIWNAKAKTDVATQLTDGLESAADKKKLDGIAEGADVNQNAFSNIKVGDVTISANGETATFILAAGDNITISADNATKQIRVTANIDGGNADMVDGYHAEHFAAADHGHDYIPTDASCNKNWNWYGQDGQPTWIWGGEDGTNMYVYNPSNFSVNYANSAGNAATLDGHYASAFAGNSHNHDGAYLPYIAGLTSGYVRTGQKDGTTIGDSATAEGSNTTASGRRAHAEGLLTTASGEEAHVEGWATMASGDVSHAEGWLTTASGGRAHAEGQNTTASGDVSHAEGWATTASGNYSYANGRSSIAYGICSKAMGYYVVANTHYQTIIGRYNVIMGDGVNYYPQSDSLFIVGNGDAEENRKNVFRVQGNGSIYSTGAYNTSGADYAEYFEWADENPKNEDRVGYFVTIIEDKIKIANSGDYILGVVSGTASVIGNSQEDQWKGMELHDEWGRVITEEVVVPEKTEDIETEDGTKETIVIMPKHTEIRPKINPNYDNLQKYTPRSQRSEWSPIGMLGVLLVRDDGTCQVNGFCKVANGGIATKADFGYRVIKRIKENIIKVILK